MSHPISDEAIAAVLAAVEVHGFGQALHVIAAQVERELKANQERRDVLGEANVRALSAVAINVNQAASQATEVGL